MKKNFLSVAVLLTITANLTAQNVGIGTTNPSDKLSVVNLLPGYGITHAYGPVKMGTFISDLNGQFGTKTNHPLQFFTNSSAAQVTLLQDGNIGIGTTTPTYKLDVLTTGVAGARIKSTSNFCVLDIDAASGDAAIRFVNNGVNKWNIRNRPSDDNFEIFELGGGGSRMVVQKSTGNIGIGGVDPQTILHVKQTDNGLGLRLTNKTWDWDVYTSNGGGLNFNYNGVNKGYISPIDGSYVATSDARLKKDVNTMPAILDKVMALQPKTYKYLDNKETDRTSTGFIAQEVLPLFPELVSDFQHPTNDTTDNTIYHGINYAGFGVVAIKAIQEQQQQIEKQQQQIEIQQKEIDLLKEQMKRILDTSSKK
jgi:hypothetical protein